MSRVNKYLLFNFLGTFASLFSTLFFDHVDVFFIQIASYHFIHRDQLWQLFKLYSFYAPTRAALCRAYRVFVSLAMTLFRLSKENESIVIFTLGARQIK